ncbi:MAG: hypothetical protein WC285_04220 [Candidatus Gracilibacteria bacterium]|jgi:hypothetical protein
MPAKKSCCSGSCCSGGKSHPFATIITLIVIAVVAYFAYVEYSERQAVPLTVDDVGGVTTVTPGSGLVPDGPPGVVAPLSPPPTN